MDYYLRIAAMLLYFLFFLHTSTYGQKVAESSYFTRNNQDVSRYSLRYDLVDEVNPKPIPEVQPAEPFHDIYTIRGEAGKTRRVHYAVDDNGIRANFHSNTVNFGRETDPSTVFFGSRLNRWPAPNPNPAAIQDRDSPSVIPSAEQEILSPPVQIPEAFVPFRPSQIPFLPEAINGGAPSDRDLQREISVQDSRSPSEVLTDDHNQNTRLFPDGQAYEPIRIPRPVSEAGYFPVQGGEYRDLQRIVGVQAPSVFTNAEQEVVPKAIENPGTFVPFRPPQSPILPQSSVAIDEQNLEKFVPAPEVPFLVPGQAYEPIRAPKSIDYPPQVEGVGKYLTMFNLPSYDFSVYGNPANQPVDSVSPAPNSPVGQDSFLPKPNSFVKTQEIFDPVPVWNPNVQNAQQIKFTSKDEAKLNTSVQKSLPKTESSSLFPKMAKIPSTPKSVEIPSSGLPGTLSFSKSIISSPMSTIFDSEKENGQYYHYVMNLGRKSGSNSHGRTKFYSTGNGLFKILNQTGIHFQPDRITYSNKKNHVIPSAESKKTDKPLIASTEKSKKSDKNDFNSVKFDLATAGDVLDTSKLVELSPIATPPKEITNAIENKKMSENVMNEILQIIDTEEPRSEIPKQSLAETSTPVSDTETSTPDYSLEDIFDFSPEHNDAPTENPDKIQSKTTSLQQTVNIQNEVTPLFITLPEEPLDALFLPGNIQDEDETELLKENDQADLIDALLSDFTTTSVSNQETTSAVTILNSSTAPTISSSSETTLMTTDPTTPSTMPTSTTTEIPTTIAKDTTVTSSSTSHVPGSDKDNLTTTEQAGHSTAAFTTSFVTEATTEIPTTITPHVNDTSVAVMVEVTDSKSLTTIPQTAVPSEESKSDKHSEDNRLKVDSSKPMLELLIQNTEMNDFMSRINNMPIMIRVLNPQTQMQQQTETNSEAAENSIPENLTVTPQAEDSTKRDEVSEISEAAESSKTTEAPEVINDLSTVPEVAALPVAPTTSARPTVRDLKVEATRVTNPTKKSKTARKISNVKEEKDLKEDAFSSFNQSALVKPEFQESSIVETLNKPAPAILPLRYTLISSDNFGTEPNVFDTGLPKMGDYSMKLIGDMEKFNPKETSSSYLSGSDAFLFPMTGETGGINIEGMNKEQPLQLIPVFFEDELHGMPQENGRLVEYQIVDDHFRSSMPSVQEPMYDTFSQPKNLTLPTFQGISSNEYNLPPSVEYVDFLPYEDLEQGNRASNVGENSYSPETVMYLDNYDIIPSNDDQQKEYVIVGGGGNFETSSPVSDIYPQATNMQEQSVFMPVNMSPKYGVRLPHEKSTGMDL